MPTLIPSSDEVRIYEIAVMYAADIEQKEENILLKEIDAHFAEAGSKLIFKDVWSKRGLAYPVGGHMEAKYVIYYIEVDPAKIRNIDHELRLQKGMLRHMIVIPPKNYEARSFEDLYQNWIKSRESVEDIRKKKQEEKVQQNVVASAKRATKRMEEKKKIETKPVEIGDLTEKLDALISDDLKI